MHIGVTGASGFIASQIVTDLINQGHQVTCFVRNVSYTQNLFPTAKVIHCNFEKDTSVETWLSRLQGIDVVINCVGILYHPRKQKIWAIHYDTPCALFQACTQTNVKKIIQLSALGIDQSSVEYSKSKKAAEDFLQSLPIQSIILRPSLVYGRGSYGGTSLFRGLSGLPWFLPIPGQGNQEFQPIYLKDLSKAILSLINLRHNKNLLLHAVSSEKISLKEILIKIRCWLGFAKAQILFVPLWLIRLGSFCGDFIPYSAINSTSYKMLIQNNVTTENETNKFAEIIGFKPKNFEDGLYHQPSTVQDHWHAKLFFMKPILQMSIAFIWIFTAVVCLFIYPKSSSFHLLNQIGIHSFWQPIIFYSACFIDIVIGFAMLIGWQLKKIGIFQIVIILIYTLLITLKLPQLWIEPFGPIAKNIPLIAAILTFLALESDR